MEQSAQAPKKGLLEYLPAIYQEPVYYRPDQELKNYLPAFLEPFERILLGVEEESASARAKGDTTSPTPTREVESLREKIGRLHELFDPDVADPEFLPWLAGWAALSLRPTLREDRKRRLIANIIPLYRKRGTRAYLEELLKLCIDIPATVSEEEIPPLQVGVHSTVGEDTYIGGGPPHFFRVRLTAWKLNAIEVQAQRQLAYEVVELAKPAHTGYEFQMLSPEMQIGVHSKVGLDTVLGVSGSVGVKGV